MLEQTNDLEFERALGETQRAFSQLENRLEKNFAIILGETLLTFYPKLAKEYKKPGRLTRTSGLSSALGQIFLMYQDEEKFQSLVKNSNKCTFVLKLKTDNEQLFSILGTYLSFYDTDKEIRSELRDPFEITPRMRRAIFRHIFFSSDDNSLLGHLSKSFLELQYGYAPELFTKDIPKDKKFHDIRTERLNVTMWVQYLYGKGHPISKVRLEIAEEFEVSKSTLERWETDLRVIPEAVNYIENAYKAGKFDFDDTIDGKSDIQFLISNNEKKWPTSNPKIDGALKAKKHLKQNPLTGESFAIMDKLVGDKKRKAVKLG